MSNVLTQICANKRAHVESQKAHLPLEEVQARLNDVDPPRGFLTALKAAQNERVPVIAEIKKGSPSQGMIRSDFDPVHLAQIYTHNGATCLSVLTDQPYFMGHDDYLLEVHEAVQTPLLRKDFMIDPYQIYESRILGADCILLIAAALSDEMLASFYDITKSLGMDALFEVHDEPELNRVMRLNPDLVGVNNRNLKALDVSLQTSFDLGPEIPSSVFRLSESGINNIEDRDRLLNAGYNGFLIGEHFMRQDDVGGEMKKFAQK